MSGFVAVADVKLIPAICPRCGASLKLPEDKLRLFCMYCGTQIIIGTGGAGSRIPCKTCEGFGRLEMCKACNGSGKCTWVTHSPGHRHESIFMIGFSSRCDDGMCSACGGRGSYMLGICPACDGTGRCPECHGVGKCHVCRGLGSIPDPNGNMTCHACGGSGVIEPGIAPKPEPARKRMCRECGRELRDSDTTCPFCAAASPNCPGCGAPWIPGTTYCQSCWFGKGQNERR